jgi:hypothetical protein
MIFLIKNNCGFVLEKIKMRIFLLMCTYMKSNLIKNVLALVIQDNALILEGELNLKNLNNIFF